MTDTRAVGFLNLNKPLRLTSHDAVAKVRRRYRALTGATKVGHAGTLDPLAEGVLVICLGAATRLSEYVMRGRKLYRAQVAFGVATSTYDAAGEILSRHCPDHIRRPDLEGALPDFIGDIAQLPPMFSAIKVGGKKLYDLARQGKTIERQARPVTIYAIKLLSWRNPVARLEIECGAGTYIRSLAHDLGAALGVGAHLSGLTRVASGAFHLRDSLPLAAIDSSDDWLGRVISPFDALTAYARVTVDEADVKRLRQGQFVARPPAVADPVAFAFDRERQLVAILEPREDRWKPRKVFASGS